MEDDDKVLEELKDIMVERLKFEPSHLSIGIEERFGFVIDEGQDLRSDG